MYTYILYVIAKYNLNTTEIGIVLFCSSSTMIFNIMISFNILSKKYGVFIACFIGFVISGTSTLFSTLVNNIWIHFMFAVIGINSGFGIIFPSIVSMIVDFTSMENRGKIMGYLNLSRSLASIIGPLLNAVTFDINIRYPFIIASAFINCAIAILLVLIVKFVAKD